MPSVKSLNQEQYYGHPQNQFWKLMYALFDSDVEQDYAQRVQFLLKNKIALWDVLQECERKGSMDHNITHPKANDFESFFKSYPNIKTIAFSSKNACKLFEKHIGFSEDFTYLILPSPSPAYAVMSFDRKFEQWNDIIQYIE